MLTDFENYFAVGNSNELSIY